MTIGLANHTLSVLAAGLGVLADVTGSATLVLWFRPSGASRGERKWQKPGPPWWWPRPWSS
jgi:hypothetical protein